MDHIRPLTKRIVFLTGRSSKEAPKSVDFDSTIEPQTITSNQPTSDKSAPKSISNKPWQFSCSYLFKFVPYILLSIVSLLFIAFITFQYANQNQYEYASIPLLQMPLNQPRFSTEDWNLIRHLIERESNQLIDSFANQSNSQHILASRSLRVCQSIIDEKQTQVRLSQLLVTQLSNVRLTDLTVNPTLGLISLLFNFQKPILNSKFDYQVNASIDREDSINASLAVNTTGDLRFEASDWKLAVFAQLHQFDIDAQRVYLRDVELRSLISNERLHLDLRLANAGLNQSASIRAAISDCASEQLRQILEVQIENFIQSRFICNALSSPLCSKALNSNSVQKSVGSSYRPTIAFYTHDLEHVLQLNATSLNAFHEHHQMTDLPADLAKRLTEEQKSPVVSDPSFEADIRQQFDQKLEQMLNKALLDMQSPSDVSSQFGSEDLTSESWSDGLVTDADDEEKDESESAPLSRSKRQVPCERGQELDEYVDSLFRFASRIVRAMEPFSLPNATIDLPEYNMKLFLHHGGATRAYTLSRKRAAWVYCTNESVSLGLTVGFEDLRVKYKYRAIKDWSLLWDGELEAKLEHTKLQVQFTQTTPDEDSEIPVMQRVDRIRIWRVGHVRVMIKGLGNLTQGVSMLLTNMLNQNIAQLDPSLRTFEKEAIVIANRMLQNVSIPFFSII